MIENIVSIYSAMKSTKIIWNSYGFVKIGLSRSKEKIVLFASMKYLMESAFHFTLKAFFVLKMFKFLSWLFGHVEKMAWLKYDVTTCLTNNYNAHIA